MEELRRRMDWHERRGDDVDLGVIVEGMKPELSGRSSLQALGRRYGSRLAV